jgi:hypothetical protein
MKPPVYGENGTSNGKDHPEVTVSYEFVDARW